MKSKLIASILSLIFIGGVGASINSKVNPNIEDSNKVIAIEDSKTNATINKDNFKNTTENVLDNNNEEENLDNILNEQRDSENVSLSLQDNTNTLELENLSLEVPTQKSINNFGRSHIFKVFWWNNFCGNNKPVIKPDGGDNGIIGDNTENNKPETEKPPVNTPEIEKPPVNMPEEEKPPVNTPPQVEKPPVTENKPQEPSIDETPQTPPSVEETPEVTPPTEQAPSVNSNFIAQVEQAIFNKVNAERAKVGVPALTYNNTMQKYARIKSQDMGDKNYFSHEDLNGNLITVQMKKDGVSYRAWGENIAYIGGISDANALANKFMTNWMNSSGHRANILSTNFSSIGVGVYKIGNKVYATQEFYR